MTPYQILADSVVLVHLVFVAFALFGGLLVLRWKQVLWVHVPAALWAALVEFAGWYCPLTPLENWLRARAGEAGYREGFIEHYILPVLYPAELTVGMQIFLGCAVVGINALIYWRVYRARRAQSPVGN